ncbi:DUF4783 domain-containing protein [Chitinophaga cymbidii]|nr:DUF4783 domain-containing protein [Chitinophaga cymbidii]
MKKLIFGLGVLLACGMFTAFTLMAGPFEDVVAALKKGDVTALSKQLDKTVEINIGGRSNSYSKAQADIILKDFFEKNQVKSFELIHQGEAGGGSRFGVGKLVTSGGEFRLSFFLQKKGDVLVLNELRFESK